MTNTRPRLTRSVPFWILLGGSVVSIGVGAYVLVEKLATMATKLADGTATGVEVYAGQIWAVLGAIMIGAGLIGLALGLTLAVLRSFVPVDVTAEPVWDVVDEPAVDATPTTEVAPTEVAHTDGVVHTDDAETTPTR